MKTNKSPETTELTPSKKKLKQARLPFKLLTDATASPPTPPSRKRKLSAPNIETATKIGKICKENEVTETGSPVVISDEESKDSEKPPEEPIPMNPYVKLVDNAWKKKLQKSKTPRKKSNPKKKTKDLNVSLDCPEGVTVDCDIEIIENDVEMVDLDKSKANDKCSDAKQDKDCDQDANQSVDKTEGVDIKYPRKENKTHSNSSADLIPENNDKSLSTNNTNKVKGIPKDNDTGLSPMKEPTVGKGQNPGSVSPKRSARIKANADEINKLATSSPKMDDNISYKNTTPKRNSTTSVSNSLDRSMTEKNGAASLTPKQLQKKMESAKKREEREKEKQERDKKRQQEKDERAKLKLEKEELKRREREEKEDAKRKEKEEKEELRRIEKEEKDRQKELEKKLKEEKEELKRKEREEKEEQRRKEKEARDEEKRKKQEAQELEKQEQELKKKKAAEAFVNFFVPKQKTEYDHPTIGFLSKNQMLSSFTIKVDMRLAPTVRVNLSDEKKKYLDTEIEEQKLSKSNLYLNCLKDAIIKPLGSGKTWPLSDKDDDCMIIGDELPPVDSTGQIITCDSTVREKLRPKLLSFHENRRPPFWGTWRKKSTFIKPRRPFGQDEKQLYYEVDSDDEWEEEQEGESIDGSAAGSDDEQEVDEYEVDNEVFVPHGYLSDEEATMEEDDILSNSPETQKARLKHLEDEFESEMKKPTEKLKPRLYGLIWETSDRGKPENCVDVLWNYFGKLSMILNDPTPLLQPSNETEEAEKKKVKKKKIPTEGEQSTQKSEKKKKVKTEEKESSKVKTDTNKNAVEVKKNQPAINAFLTKLKTK